MTTAAGVPRPPSIFGVFRNRNFVFLWLAEFINEMGTAIMQLAASLYVFEATGSTLSVGMVMIVSAAPSLLFGLVAGVFVDRYDRRRIMIIVTLVQGLVILAVPPLLSSGLVWLYILIAATSTIGQLFSPAHASILPDIATEEELNAANSMMAISRYGSLAIGFALAGFIIDGLSVAWAFYLDALTFFIAGALIFFVKVPPLVVTGETTARVVVENLRAGAATIRHTAILRSLFLVYVPIGIVFGFANTLRVPFTLEVLGTSNTFYGFLESITIVGFVLASLMMARVGERLNEGQWMAISFISLGFTGMTFAVNPFAGIALFISLVEGFLNAPSVIARTLIIQRNTAREMRGRVFSAFFVARDALFMFGMALAGVADFFDVRVLYFAGSAVGLLAGVSSLFMPGFRETAAAWRQALTLLRTAPTAPGLGAGVALTRAGFDRLAGLVPPLAALPVEQQNRLMGSLTLHEVAEGTAVLREGEMSDAAYFIVDGQAVAGRSEGEQNRVLEVLREGDFFGEIAALTGVPRTADIITQSAATIVRVPAPTLHEMADDPALNRLFYTRMQERLGRLQLDLPIASRLDQGLMLELRTQNAEQAQVAPLPAVST